MRDSHRGRRPEASLAAMWMGYPPVVESYTIVSVAAATPRMHGHITNFMNCNKVTDRCFLLSQMMACDMEHSELLGFQLRGLPPPFASKLINLYKSTD